MRTDRSIVPRRFRETECHDGTFPRAHGIAAIFSLLGTIGTGPFFLVGTQEAREVIPVQFLDDL